MATEAQQQRALLDSGFLDTLGGNPDELELNEVEKIFVKWMGELLEAMQRNLNDPKNGREITASGQLSQSIHFEYTTDGKSYRAQFLMADYADFRDKGVQGIGPGSKNTTSPYKFKTAFPSRNMQNALALWVQEKNLLSDITAPKGLLGKNTRNLLKDKNKSSALIIGLGKSIKQKGIEASNFKQASIDEVMDAMMAELATAMAMDIKVSIETSTLR